MRGSTEFIAALEQCIATGGRSFLVGNARATRTLRCPRYYGYEPFAGTDIPAELSCALGSTARNAPNAALLSPRCCMSSAARREIVSLDKRLGSSTLGPEDL